MFEWSLATQTSENCCYMYITNSSERRILKKGGQKLQKFERNIDQNLKSSHSNFGPFFAQNQVKSKNKKQKKEKGLYSNSVPFFAQNQVISSPKPDARLAKGGGGGACLNFAHFSMQLCNPGDPKGGVVPKIRPWSQKYAQKYAPKIRPQKYAPDHKTIAWVTGLTLYKNNFMTIRNSFFFSEVKIKLRMPARARLRQGLMELQPQANTKTRPITIPNQLCHKTSKVA